ncbi:adenylosuccinate lyase family protein [Rhodobacteraceae bacterium R_SAG10]|jgi:3-carboxy-cis,cis-muconate cycloisomerase|nr:adenylosuccinate lyase family protein [Rhodobacteraceae bacterium R_SAG10]
MPASPFDSSMYRDLFGDAEVADLFSDSAEIRALLRVLGELARAQGDLGLIPTDSAAAIHAAAQTVQIDAATLAHDTGQNAVVIPALVQALRAAMQAPEHAQYLHWGATSQDIIDTGLILRLADATTLYQRRLTTLTKSLGQLADTHANLPMAARTWGQSATITSFGAVLASWGSPLIRHLDRLGELTPRLLQVSLSGAAGTLSAMGGHGPQVRANLAKALNLNDPQTSWHSTRDPIAELSAWMTLVTGSVGKIGEDMILLAQSGIDEITLATSGASSTMPQKSNPVLAALMAALARHTSALNTSMQGAIAHRAQRDGVAWLSEWLALPQICAACGRALAAANTLATEIAPNATRMAANIEQNHALIYAEALTFALANQMPRPQAQTAIKALCQQAIAENTSLIDLATSRWPDAGLAQICTPAAQLGDAPAQARRFAKAAAWL